MSKDTSSEGITADRTATKLNGVNGVNGHSSDHKDEDKDVAATTTVTVTITPPPQDAKAEESTEEKDEKPEEEEDKTMKCEIKHLDRRYDDDDQAYYEERKQQVDKPEQQDWWQLYAFCIVRTFNSDNEHAYTKLVVNSKPLQQLLFDVVGDYPGYTLSMGDMQISSPYHSLFHRRKQIEEQGRDRFAGDETSLAQLRLLVEWITKHFELDIAAYEQCVGATVKAIAYDHLWTIFPANQIVYARVMNHNRAFRVKTNWYDCSDIPGLGINVSYIDYDGERLGTRRMDLFLHKYANQQELADLDVMPLNLQDDAESLRAELLERGRKFESLVGGQHFMEYSGLAIKKKEQGYARFDVSGRVMVDVKTFHRLEANDSFSAKELPYDKTARACRLARKAAKDNFVAGANARRFDRLSDSDACLTNATVRGYSFAVKRFLEFYVDQLSDIEWNQNCFDQLVLDPGTKKTVQALVSSHTRDRETFDDIVKGKGQGLVCVLHGPPGVGKVSRAPSPPSLSLLFYGRKQFQGARTNNKRTLSDPDSRVRSRVRPPPPIHGVVGRPGRQQLLPRRRAHQDHGHDVDLACGAADRRGRHIPRAAVPARPAPQRYGVRVPARARVLQRHPVPHDQPRRHL